VVYLPEVKPAIAKPPAVAMTSEYWKLPLNWETVVESVKWAAGEPLSLEVRAPLTVTAELQEQKDKGRMLVHFLNFDDARTPAVSSITVSVAVPSGRSVGQVSLVSPDAVSAGPLALASRLCN
jgi:hypothetical protein